MESSGRSVSTPIEKEGPPVRRIGEIGKLAGLATGGLPGHYAVGERKRLNGYCPQNAPGWPKTMSAVDR
jgi:hypothetical protein